MFDSRITIAGWNKLSFIDYPRLVSTVLFFAGCNMRCPWCHNPGVVLNEYPGVDFPEILTYLDKRSGKVEGVVLSGGEPTMHAGLPGVVDALRARGLKIKLDTNGLLPAVIEQCAPDYLALDIKTTPSRYHELGYVGTDVAERLARSLAIVKSMGRNAEVRITVSPLFINDSVIKELRGLLAKVACVFLQECRRDVPLLDPGFNSHEPHSLETIRQYRSMLESAVGECVIRGR